MENRFTDTQNVVESLRQCVDEADEGRLHILKIPPCRVVAATDEEMKDRNLVRKGTKVAKIEWKKALSTTSLTLVLHQSVVDNEFRFVPASHDAIGVDRQATDPAELSDELGEVLDLVDPSFGIGTWDFVSLKGESIAQGGHITDFIYEYEAVTTVL